MRLLWLITTTQGFATQLQKQLDSNIVDSSLESKLSDQLKQTFPLPVPSLAANLDDLGRSLWNSSIALRQGKWDATAVLPPLRAFAFHLLDCAHQTLSKHGRSNIEDVIRVLRVALKAGKLCIDHGHLDLCTRVFERAAAYAETRDHEKASRPQDQHGIILDNVLEELVTEYYLLRAALAWKHERGGLIDHWLSKAAIIGDRGHTVELVEKKADLLYEIGKAALKKKDYAAARKWLKQSCDAIESLNREDLSPDLCELQFAARSDLIQTLISAKDTESLEQASSLLTLLQAENTEFKMTICLLQLDLLSAQQPVDTEQFLYTLIHIIESVHMIQSNFDMIMSQIRRLKQLNKENDHPSSQSLASTCHALDALLPRLFESISQPWLEKVVVTRVWISVTEQPSIEGASKLHGIFNEVLQATGRPFTSQATHAAQSLIWKCIDAKPNAQHDGGSDIWCRLACHPLFANAGDLNKSALGRKLMLNAFARGDAATAREAYFGMPESGKAAAATKYIMYKVALRMNDAELASESLEGVLKTASKDSSYLYACALEAQSSGNRRQVIAVLQQIADHCKHDSPNMAHLPTLLRSTAKLIMVEMENGNAPKDEALPELCKIFEAALTQAKSFKGNGQGQASVKAYQAELMWFANTSYNLGVTHLAEMRPEMLLRLNTVCITFLDLLRKERGDDIGLIRRMLLCRFLAVSVLVVLARSQDNIEQSLSLYSDTRRQIGSFQGSLTELSRLFKAGDQNMDDILAKDFELLKYDLEALMKLKHWNDLDRVLEVCSLYEDSMYARYLRVPQLCLTQQHAQRWGTIADLIIHIHTHVLQEGLDNSYQNSGYRLEVDTSNADRKTEIPLVMQKIINASWKQDKHDVRKLSRWIRCLFQMTLSLNSKMALNCLENAKAVVTRIKVS